MSEEFKPTPIVDDLKPAVTPAVVDDKKSVLTEVKEGEQPAVKDGKADETKSEVTPGEYKDFTLPEGFKADDDGLKSFKELAKDAKLSQEQAQKLVDLQSSLMKKSTEAQIAEWTKVQEQWRAQAQEHKEYGGAAFKENIAFAQKALQKFGSPALREAIEATGMGNHPELIGMLVKVGKTISEDKLITGDAGAGGSKDPAKILFPNLN